MKRPTSLKGIKWLVDYVAIRCLERDDVRGFSVELFEDLGVRLSVDMGGASQVELISFCELETSSTNVVGLTLDHLFADLQGYSKGHEREAKPED